MNEVADRSLVRQPATTSPWLQRLIPVLQCVARAATTPQFLTGWPLHTYSAASVTLKCVRYTLFLSRIQSQLRNSGPCVDATTVRSANTPIYTAHK